MKEKDSGDKLYYKPSEVCKIADIKPYVLSYWETEFSQLGQNTVKGQKLYTQEDLNLVLKIKKLLYEDGFTISGAKKQLEKETSITQEKLPIEINEKSDIIDKNILREVIEDLQNIIKWIKK